MTNYALKKAIRVKKIPVEIDLEWVKDLKGIENTLELNEDLLDKSLVLQKKKGSDSIFEIVGYDLNLNLKDSINNSFADSDYDNFIIQKLRGYLYKRKL